MAYKKILCISNCLKKGETDKKQIELIRKVLENFKVVGMNHFWGNYFDSRFYIAYLVQQKKTDVILDVGCGAGVLLNFSDSAMKIGIDYSLESLKMAKKLDNEMQLICGDATQLPFKKNAFPFILAVHILPELKKFGFKWEKGLEELKRVSKRKSEIILAGNNRMSKHFKKYEYESRKSYLTCKEQELLLKDEFSVKSVGYDPFSKLLMYPLKKILFQLPPKLELYYEKIIFNILKSRRYLKGGRAYIIICRKK